MLIPKYIRAKNILSFKEFYYEFKQGTTTCVMGRNLTDSGQKSNGSGKSALQNAIELAYKGDFSRKINKAKIIRRGEKELEIESCTFNNVKNEFLFIHRIIPVKGSERISVYLFKDEQKFEQDREKFKIDISSTNDANNWIVDYIGITKEDLGNYFFPNEITYKSFFDASDTQNKALISRFSNADIVDKVFVNIQSELYKIALKLSEKEKELLKIETTLENRQEDLTKEQERDFKKEQQEQIEEIHEQIKLFKDDINNLLLKVNESLISKKNLSKNRLKIADKLNEKQIEIEKFLKTKKDFSKEIDLIEKEEDVIKIQEKEAVTLVDEVSSDILSVKSDIRKYEVKLSGTITCPKCSHEFLLSEDFTVEELNRELIKLKKEQSELEKEFQQVGHLIDKYKIQKQECKSKIDVFLIEEKGFKNELKKIQEQQEEIEEELKEVNDLIRSIERTEKSLNEQIEAKQNSIKLKEDSIKEIESTDFSKLSKEKELKKTIKELQQQIKEKELEVQEVVNESEQVKVWELHYKAFKSFLANKKLKVIEGMMNKFLNDMGVDFQIKLEGYTTVNNGKEIREKITPYIFKDGEIYGYHEFSKGERARMNMANLFTLQTIINETSKTGGLQLAVLDEILEGVDEDGLSSLLKSLETTNKTILLTTHVNNEKIHDNVLMIEKVNGISKILN